MTAYLRQQCYFTTAPDRIEIELRALFGREGASVSMLYLLTYAASRPQGLAGILNRWKSGTTSLVLGGSSLITERMANKFGNKHIVLNQAVQSIMQLDHKVRPIVESQQV